MKINSCEYRTCIVQMEIFNEAWCTKLRYANISITLKFHSFLKFSDDEKLESIYFCWNCIRMNMRSEYCVLCIDEKMFHVKGAIYTSMRDCLHCNVPMELTELQLNVIVFCLYRWSWIVNASIYAWVEPKVREFRDAKYDTKN